MRRVAAVQVAAEVHHLHGRERRLGPERVQVERLDALDRVAEEVDADRQPDLVAAVLAGQVDVDDPPADGEVAGHLDLLQAVVAVLAQPDDQLLRLQVLPGLDRADDVLERVPRRHRLHERLDRRDQQIGLPAGGVPGHQLQAVATPAPRSSGPGCRPAPAPAAPRAGARRGTAANRRPGRRPRPGGRRPARPGGSAPAAATPGRPPRCCPTGRSRWRPTTPTAAGPGRGGAAQPTAARPPSRRW